MQSELLGTLHQLLAAMYKYTHKRKLCGCTCGMCMKDSMRLACANGVLAVHCNSFVGRSSAKDRYELYAVIQNGLLALSEHFIHVCCLGNSNKGIYNVSGQLL